MADGLVEFDVRANTDKLKKDLDDSQNQIKKSAKESGKSLDKIGESVQKNTERIKSGNDAITNSNEELAGSYDETSDRADEFSESLGENKEQIDEASGATDNLTDKTSKLGSALGSTAKIAGIGFAAIGGAAVAAGGYAVNLANDMDKAMNSFVASTGTAQSEMDGYQDVLEKIYANNYGEDFQDIADSMALVQKNLGNMSDESLQQVTESAFALRDTFEYDISESTRAAKAMMDNFGISGDEAMSMIAAGAQNGLDYSGELMDSISEYSVQFAKVGFDADDMFKIFQKGAESGAFNLDKVGDAVKEFSIRAIDGSDSTAEGFNKIGLNADEMAAKFSEGGESAKAAFYETVKALASIEDPLEKDAAGVELFGTMWEDLGPKAVEALADIEDGAYDTENALENIKEVKYNDLGSMLEGLKRSVEMLALPIGEMLIPAFESLIGIITPLIDDGTLEELITSFGQFLEPLLQMATDALPAIVELFSELLSDELMPMLTDTLLPALMDIFEALTPVIEMIITDLLPPLIDAFTELIPPIAELITNLIPPLIAIFEALMPVIDQLITSLLPPLRQIFDALIPCIQALTPVIAALANMFADSLGKTIELVMPIVDSVITHLSGILDFITSVFTGNWGGAWNAVVDIFRNAFNSIPAIAESAINGAISVINGIINGINDITGYVGIPAIPTIPDVSLPRFHTGGIIDFEGKYEAPILAKDGEMVLTAAQQKRLFDIANGAYNIDSGNSNSTGSSYRTNNVNITHNNYFTVHDDSDIDKISESLSQREVKDILSLGG